MEFKTEIELLSRVHHKNVVSLIGFCFDQGEQMLVYEYITNGTLKDSLNGTYNNGNDHMSIDGHHYLINCLVVDI